MSSGTGSTDLCCSVRTVSNAVPISWSARNEAIVKGKEDQSCRERHRKDKERGGLFKSKSHRLRKCTKMKPGAGLTALMARESCEGEMDECRCDMSSAASAVSGYAADLGAQVSSSSRCSRLPGRSYCCPGSDEGSSESDRRENGD